MSDSYHRRLANGHLNLRAKSEFIEFQKTDCFNKLKFVRSSISKWIQLNRKFGFQSVDWQSIAVDYNFENWIFDANKDFRILIRYLKNFIFDHFSIKWQMVIHHSKPLTLVTKV